MYFVLPFAPHSSKNQLNQTKVGKIGFMQFEIIPDLHFFLVNYHYQKKNIWKIKLTLKRISVTPSSLLNSIYTIVRTAKLKYGK